MKRCELLPDWRLECCDWVLTSAGWLPAWWVMDLLEVVWFEMFRDEIDQDEIWGN